MRCVRYERPQTTIASTCSWVSASEPAGAFYIFADARRFGADSRALAFRLLDRSHVALTPGVDFGAAGEGFLRFSYAAADDTIRAALERLAGALEE